MRRMVFAALAVSLGGCIVTGGRPMENDFRDDRVSRQISQQERWAQQALESRPTQDQLDRIRSGDQAAVNAGRKELNRLIQAIDRGTWMRDAAAEMLRDEPDPQLVQDFDRGGRLRTQAIQAADQLASALADTRGGLDQATLQRAFASLQKAQASDDAAARQPPRAGQKLAPAPIPSPRPFTDAAAKLAAGNPDAGKQLEAQLPPDEATKLRAKAADMAREQEEQKRAEADNQPPPPAPGMPAPTGSGGGEIEAQAPSNTLSISNDVANMIAKRPPRSITLREDGLFELLYDDAAYLFDPEGKLIRKEAPQPPSQLPPAPQPPAPQR
ncbi:MAG TPA: hypothetical protein VLW85_13050 [Myxococcales bacterium]|nr:hypothetical protein [Myxococcales bacterium]